VSAFRRGAVLGMYQAHALAGSVGATVMFASGREGPALILGVGAAIGWAGWKRDYGFAWSP